MSLSNFLSKMLSQPLVRRPLVDLTILIDGAESNGVHNVYRVAEDNSITIFYSVPDNLATMTVEIEEDSQLEDGLFLSSENFEDWDELTEIIPAWPIILRRIETLYRQQIEELYIEEGIHWDSADEEEEDD